MPKRAESQPRRSPLFCLLNRAHRGPGWGWTLVLSGLLLAVGGCSRSFWRTNADANAYSILQDKAADPRWQPPRLDLQPDPRSRFFDPYDPDLEPLPPDDPAAHTYMHWMGRNLNVGTAKVDQPWHGGVLPSWLQPTRPIKGWKSWHKYGDTLSVENPQWLEPFGLTDEQLEEQRAAGTAEGPGIANLTLAQAIELSYIHSRGFQTALETLYLTALDLSFQRFRFDIRYLGLGNRRPSATVTGTDTPHVSTQLATNARLGVSQLLPTGAQWVVELANNTLWLFSSGTESSTATTLSYSLVQPLLLGAGRKFVLENLTQAERTALYAMRDFARFRQTFFVSVVTGGSGGGDSGGSSGFLGLLQQQQQIRNQRYNIYLTEQQVERGKALAAERPEFMAAALAEFPENLEIPDDFVNLLSYEPDLHELRFRGLMTREQYEKLKLLSDDPRYQNALLELMNRALSANALPLAVTQLESSLANSRLNLLSQETNYQNNLDNYKLQLGIPPDMWMSIDLSLLQQFQFISQELFNLERDITLFVSQIGVLPDDNPSIADLQAAADGLLELIERIEKEGMTLVDKDLEQVMQTGTDRLRIIESEADRARYLDFIERDQRLLDTAHHDLDDFKRQLEELKIRLSRTPRPAAPQPPPNPAAKPGEKPAEVPEIRLDPKARLADLRERVLQLVQGLEVIQLNLRVELVKLPEFEMDIDQVVQTALENRVDLMNQRALVMDARRKIEIAANALRSQVDLNFAGDLRTQPLGSGNTSPFEFRGDQSSFRAGLAFTAPVDIVQERNVYRASLITYQRQRRAYMLAEDQVKFAVRREWRQLMLLRRQFEIARLSLRLSAMSFDQAVEQNNAPVTNTGGGGGGGNSNSGLNIINGLTSVLNAQNNIISIWVNFETNRLNIHSDMGIMQIDENGVWIDDFYQNLQRGLPVNAPQNIAEPAPLEVPPAPDDTAP